MINHTCKYKTINNNEMCYVKCFNKDMCQKKADKLFKQILMHFSVKNSI